MNELWNENIKIQLQRLVPLISTILFILIFNIPLYPFVSSSIRPYVAIICVYFWLIYRPYFVNITGVYLVGILEDIISSTPFGSNIVTMLLVYVFTNLISKFVANKPFPVVWYGFAFVAFVTLIIKWLIISIYYSQFLSLSILLFSLLTTIAFYPIFSIINVFLYEHFMQDEE